MPKPSPSAEPAAERERDAESVLVDAVEHAPQAIAHRQRRHRREPAVQQHVASHSSGGIVVIADQGRAVARPHRLGAAADERPADRHSEEPRDQVAAAGVLADMLAVSRSQAGTSSGICALRLRAHSSIIRPRAYRLPADTSADSRASASGTTAPRQRHRPRHGWRGRSGRSCAHCRLECRTGASSKHHRRPGLEPGPMVQPHEPT